MCYNMKMRGKTMSILSVLCYDHKALPEELDAQRSSNTDDYQPSAFMQENHLFGNSETTVKIIVQYN